MSDAKRCDRCGTFYEPTSYSGKIFLEADDGKIYEYGLRSSEYDLCPDCMGYVAKYLDALKKKEDK